VGRCGRPPHPSFAWATILVAFRRFADTRRVHLRYFGLTTMALSPFFQAENRMLGAPAIVLPRRSCFGPPRRHMTLTMAGLAAGFMPRRFRL
jgi:hypothetical protein